MMGNTTLHQKLSIKLVQFMYFLLTPENFRGEFGEQLNSNVRGFE